jgi:hypothetical protein
MTLSRFDKLIAHILKEAGAPGATHELLQEELTKWAQANGYSKVYQQFQNGARPDVLRATADDLYLFVGDAKDSSNETPDNAETLQRIWTYVQEFGNLLGDPRYKGGTIAIITDSAQAASQWVIALNLLARMAKITGYAGAPANFQVEETNPGRTWIIHW